MATSVQVRSAVFHSAVLIRSTVLRVCSSHAPTVMGTQAEKTLIDYDYFDETADGPHVIGADQPEHRSSLNSMDRACLACRRCCGPCCTCSSRFQLALLSSVGFCISFGIRCNMGVAVLQMTSNITRFAVTPLIPGTNVTIEVVSFNLIR